ncbi:precorrin-2 dehydrogenase/sirohydrochlorin ferrochelatase family protein [Anaerocolumna xylanovorans]|uniref:precorrin-2 dehydrogenase n=1 Tax=Anaerocolumna xylanovorans DSM 12503 TaxID=1121345 RepID=A0A1M7Y5K0_9FIRM|nr:bifunctional precorrin-2 dehydrogenase/sirohydrochlorin ferrochelatase [Anaerocolumna xylanovorans]SHO47699.1 precorrin-2 dehydrogenase / sirohydrochlorin ferrochelatase [Anaerocolumna xylanovorans DSM 12503]
MAYFPFFIDIKNKKCIIYGGGKVAYRKIEALLDFEADITVIAPVVSEEIAALEGRIHINIGEYGEKELEDAFFVIAATNNSAINEMIAKNCRDRKILVNVVDELSKCDFLFPAYIKKGSISIGVTTSGQSPVMAGHIRKTISDNLPDTYEALVETLGGYREYVKNNVSSESERADIMKELARLGLNNNGKLNGLDVQNVISKYMK